METRVNRHLAAITHDTWVIVAHYLPTHIADQLEELGELRARVPRGGMRHESAHESSEANLNNVKRYALEVVQAHVKTFVSVDNESIGMNWVSVKSYVHAKDGCISKVYVTANQNTPYLSEERRASY